MTAAAQKLAGAAAVDCGIGSDPASDLAVYSCGEEKLSRTGFTAMFLPHSGMDVVTDQTGLPPIVYASRGDGELYAIESIRGEPAVTLVGRNLPARWGGWRGASQADVARPEIIQVGGRGLNAVVIVELKIDGDGRVVSSRILKSAAGLPEEDLHREIRQIQFVPSRLFGIPVTAVENIVLRFTSGEAALTARR